MVELPQHFAERAKSLKTLFFKYGERAFSYKFLVEKRWVSLATVNNTMIALRKVGLLRKMDKGYGPTKFITHLPYFENINAWFEERRDRDDVEEWYRPAIPMGIPHPNDTIVVRVKWDSMVDKHIADGSLLLVDNSYKDLQYLIGKIVAVFIDGAYCVKELLYNAGIYTLRSHNKEKNYPDLSPSEEAHIIGKVLYSINEF